ncbi:MAG: patatin-like phospholipase family protein [Pseudomonadota bacterium]
MSAEDFTTDFEAVAAAEREWIRKRQVAAGVPESDRATGLALSGGGIRSATFCLGVLQALADRRILKDVDYLSSVSGGGFVASCLTWIRSQVPTSANERPFDLPVDEDGESVVDSLRAHGKYLIAEQGFTGWTLGASIIAATLLNLLVVVPPLLLLLGIAAADTLPVEWPAWAHLQVATPVRAHDGFVLALWSGLAALALYPFAVLAFAWTAGIRTSSRSAVMRIRKWMGVLLSVGIGLLIVGLVPLVVSIEQSIIQRFDDEWLQLLVKAGVVAFHLLGGVFILGRSERRRRKTGKQSRGAAVLGLTLILYALLLTGYHIVVDTQALDSPWLWLGATLSVILAFTCDLNRISMHSYYRARLTEAFLPTVFGETSPQTDAFAFRMQDVQPESGTPLHIVNTTLCTNNSKLQKLRARGAASFFMTPLFCGSTATGYRDTKKYRHGRTTLSTAMTISGAAVDPNTEVTRARPVAFLMALLNFRLGFWASNPRAEKQHLPLPWWYIFMEREMFGHGLNEHKQHIHLSDGGHFDNLGVYELVRRRCRRIIVCDAGADPHFALADLGLAIQRVRVDFGAEIVLHCDELVAQARHGAAQKPFSLGTIRYADGSTGEILYIKPMIRQKLSADIYAYQKAHPEFPNQSTANQFFDAQQFDAYRELGRQITSGIAGSKPIDSIDGLFACARELCNDESQETLDDTPRMSVVPNN